MSRGYWGRDDLESMPWEAVRVKRAWGVTDPHLRAQLSSDLDKPVPRLDPSRPLGP